MKEYLDKIFAVSPLKLVLSKGIRSDYRKIVITKKNEDYQAEMFTEKQVFHKTLAQSEVISFCENAAGTQFMQLNAWDGLHEHILLFSKKGKVTYKRREEKITAARPEHNRKKSYILAEGTVIPPLVDMGIFTKEGKVAQPMYDKYRQINRFVEIIDDAVKKDGRSHYDIIDFGCGKSYLTFIVYYYFTEIIGADVRVTGLDLKADVIKNCAEAARRYGYDNLHFKRGDISGFARNTPADIVIALHACDTATDYALFNAVTSGARMIFSVPCCQHELNKQISSERLSILTRYGIIRERTAALMTDAIRGNLLEAAGYKTQLLEFIDMEHTPKNILIRAVKQPVSDKVRRGRLEEAQRLMEEFSLSPTLYNLLEPSFNGLIKKGDIYE